MYQPRRVDDSFVATPPTGAARFAAGPAPRRVIEVPDPRWSNGTSLALGLAATVATAGTVFFSNVGNTAFAAPEQLDNSPVAAIAAPAAAQTAEPTIAPITIQVAGLVAPKAATKARKPDTALLSVTPLYTTGSLNVRAEADSQAELLGKVARGVEVTATSQIEGDYRRIEFEKGYGWVLTKNLANANPDGLDSVTVSAGTTMDPCSRGSGPERRLRKDTIHIYRSVCALFPEINSIGGWRAGGRQFHKNGRALDLMLTPGKESALGKRIAAYLIAHAREFNIDHIIFEQKIWTPRSPRWRHMADRGGTTANHYDHVHVAIRA